MGRKITATTKCQHLGAGAPMGPRGLLSVFVIFFHVLLSISNVISSWGPSSNIWSLLKSFCKALMPIVCIYSNRTPLVNVGQCLPKCGMGVTILYLMFLGPIWHVCKVLRGHLCHLCKMSKIVKVAWQLFKTVK